VSKSGSQPARFCPDGGMADTLDLKSSVERRAGSNPARGTATNCGPSEKKDGTKMTTPAQRVAEVEVLDEDKQQVLEAVREQFERLLSEVDDLLPESREKSLVVTNVEQAYLWARQCVEQNDVP
jgi:hypothetical protein